MEKNNPRTLNAWCMYDWANSVYSLTITTAVFPIYYGAVTRAGAVRVEGERYWIDFFGLEVQNSVIYSFALSFAFVSIAFINPLLSGIADYSGKKKAFMKFFAWMGALACMALMFFDAAHIWVGLVFFVIATVGYAGSLVFYNAYLPEIATSDQFDKVSARGFSMGYIGSVLLLVVNILMLQKPSWFGLADEGQAARISFLTVGLWWLGFSMYSFLGLPKDLSVKNEGQQMLSKGYQEVNKVFRQLIQMPRLRNFLLGFFFYNMSFQTIMYLASIFGAEELHIPTSGLIATILIIQLIAILGAYLFTLSSKRFGNIYTLIFALFFALVITICAYLVQTANQFYLLAVLVGLIMGGIQSISRSTYSKLLPAETKDNASFFSFYELTDKVGTALGTAVFGLANALTGNMRDSLFPLFVFFIVGLFFLNKIKKEAVKETI
jgi:MFS transporter, UMF1 family